MADAERTKDGKLTFFEKITLYQKGGKHRIRKENKVGEYKRRRVMSVLYVVSGGRVEREKTKMKRGRVESYLLRNLRG